MKRYDIVRCIRCNHLLYFKDAEISKQGSQNFGIKTEYMCEKCYQLSGYEANAVIMEGQKRRAKNWKP